MAIAQSNLTTANNNVDQVSYTTASITPSANALIMAAIHVGVASGVPPTITLTGNGLTWEVVDNTALTGLRRAYIFRAMGGSPTTGAVTITGDGTTVLTHGAWSIAQFTGTDTSGANGSGAIAQSVNSKPTGATSVSVGFPTTPDPSSAGFSVVGTSVNEAPTPGSGWTTNGTSQTYTAPASGVIAQYSTSACPVAVEASWTTSAFTLVVGAEINPAVSVALVEQIHPPYRAARMVRGSQY